MTAFPSTLHLYLDYNPCVHLHKHTHMPTQSPPQPIPHLKDSEANKSRNYRNQEHTRRRLEILTSMKNAELSVIISFCLGYFVMIALEGW